VGFVVHDLVILTEIFQIVIYTANQNLDIDTRLCIEVFPEFLKDVLEPFNAILGVTSE
jgi:hypothetical protein